MHTDFAEPAFTDGGDPLISAYRARAAQSCFAKCSQDRVDDVVAAVGWRLFRKDVARRLSEASVLESGIGNIEDTLHRHQSRIVGTLREMSGALTLGLVEDRPAKGLRRFAKPVGVIAALTPRTAPIASMAVHSLNALKTRNALVICPNPAVINAVRQAVAEIRSTLADLDAPEDLIQVISDPSRANVMSLLEQADLFVATGGQRLVRRALKTGTPGFAGGPGSAVIIVDETADVEMAAKEIILAKSFDHGTSCSSESCILVARPALSGLRKELEGRGAFFLSDNESQLLCRLGWPSGGGINPSIIGRSALEIAAMAGIDAPPTAKVLIVSAGSSSDVIAGKEKLSPILFLAAFDRFEEALKTAGQLIAQESPGHSCGIYSRSPERVEAAATMLHVGRLMVNQSTGFGNTGSSQNGMPSTVVLSCGTWGGMNTTENITWRHYLNYTLVSEVIAAPQQSASELFGRHWEQLP